MITDSNALRQFRESLKMYKGHLNNLGILFLVDKPGFAEVVLEFFMSATVHRQ